VVEKIDPDANQSLLVQESRDGNLVGRSGVTGDAMYHRCRDPLTSPPLPLAP
jgi:hypothetical protein